MVTIDPDRNKWSLLIQVELNGHYCNPFMPILLVTFMYFKGSLIFVTSKIGKTSWSQNKPFFADFDGHIFVLQRYFDFCSVFDTYRSTVGVS